MRKLALIATGVLAALVLAACGGGAAEDPTVAGSPEVEGAGATVEAPTAADASSDAGAGSASDADAGSTALSEAEVTFLTGMIPHHRQAVEMAELVADRTDRPELNSLADAIITTQNAEIETMSGLLESAGEEVPADDAEHGGGMDMGGDSTLMSAEDMEALAALSDEEFDLRFVEMMIEHHTSAIEQAETVLAAGPGPEVTTLANAIITAQQAEIEQMQAWQQEWSA